MKKRSVLTSPRLEELKKKKRKILIYKIIFSVFCIVILLVGLSYISRLARFNINAVEISGNQVIDTDQIKDVINADLAGRYLWIFPKTNFLLYPKGKIKNDLGAKFKRLENISISLKGMKTLEIAVSERTAKYTWCGAMPDPKNTQCDFMDENGYIFDTAPYFSGNVYFKFYGTNGLNISDPVGKYFASDIFQKLIAFKQAAEIMGLKPAGFYLLDNRDIQMFLVSGNSTSVNPEIIFNTSEDFSKIAENLQTALSTEPLKTDFANKYSSLLYIDLSFGNKVYYKFK